MGGVSFGEEYLLYGGRPQFSSLCRLNEQKAALCCARLSATGIMTTTQCSVFTAVKLLATVRASWKKAANSHSLSRNYNERVQVHFIKTESGKFKVQGGGRGQELLQTAAVGIESKKCC